MKHFKNALIILAAFIIADSGAVIAQPSLSMYISPGSYVCKPGTVTLHVTVSGPGCNSVWAQSLEYSANGTSGWAAVKTYSNIAFTGNGTANPSFTDDISALTLLTGYFRFGFYGFDDYCCSGCCFYWCGFPAYSGNYFTTFLYNDAGPDKTYQPNCAGRAQIGTPSSGNNISCTPTYAWTPATNLYPTQTGGTACSPCTAAQYWAAPPVTTTYTRTMTCGGNVCADQVKVKYSTIGCRTALNSGNTEISAIEISPNPTSGHFSISGNTSAIGEIFIYDNLGQLVQHFKITDSQKEIFLNNKGIYRIRIQNEQGISTSTLVVN